MMLTLVADKGFAGKEFKQITEAMAAEVAAPRPQDETYTNGKPRRHLPVDRVGQPDPQKDSVTSNDTADAHQQGEFTRVAQRLLAQVRHVVVRLAGHFKPVHVGKNARRKIGARTEMSGYKGNWVWVLPDTVSPTGEN